MNLNYDPRETTHEIKYRVSDKYQLMFPEVGDCFFFNGEFVYVTEVFNDGAYLNNGDVFYVGNWIKRIEEKK